MEVIIPGDSLAKLCPSMFEQFDSRDWLEKPNFVCSMPMSRVAWGQDLGRAMTSRHYAVRFGLCS